MAVRAYCRQTSVPQGGTLDLHLAEDSGQGADATVTVREVFTGREMSTAPVHVKPYPSPTDPAADHNWPVAAQISVPTGWPSGLYAAEVSPSADPEQDRVFFVVRAADPGSSASVVVAVPFPTFHAYAYFGGTPGASVYYNEQPERARRVSLHRPSPVAMDWEEPILQWLAGSGYEIEYCSSYDLHDGRALLARYRMLVCIGHDEYWSAGMRDTVEAWVASGGNVAFLTGNTCWWQFRLEDDGATFVCYRDAVEDPLTGQQDHLVTVEWGSAPLRRPENQLLGVSFRRGAGCWNNLDVMADTGWTVRFAEHWVFAGTGLAEGAQFGRGTVGYETDAAELVEVQGVPRVTGRDGTPADFVVLATADLGSWREFGQGGAATMGLWRSPGGGTVFNAATTGWGAGLHPAADPVVERITRNVLDRLQRPPAGPQWEVIGRAEDVVAMVACENVLYAVDCDGALWTRDPVTQNVPWTSAGTAPGVRALASPREAVGDAPIGLYALTVTGELQYRPPVPDAPWTRRRDAADLVALAALYQSFFAVTTTDDLVTAPLDDATKPWTHIGAGGGITALTNLNGRLFGASADTLWTRRPDPGPGPDAWERIADLPGPPAALTGYAGGLYLATTDGLLHRRDAVR
jgi:hypothetical protein